MRTFATLKARKCKDGEWLIEYRETLVVATESDVNTLIRQNGLKRQKGWCDEETIYAK